MTSIVTKLRLLFENYKGAKVGANQLSQENKALRDDKIRVAVPLTVPALTEKFIPVDAIKTLPWHPTKKWKTRDLKVVDSIIVHQSLSKGTVVGVNNYHISPENHISADGCPHICYHFAIDSDSQATVYQCNHLEDVTWHTQGKNTTGIGIVVIGDFNGKDHVGSSTFDDIRKKALKNLLDYLIKIDIIPNVKNKNKIYGHQDFGKPACPGYDIYGFVSAYKMG